MTATMPMTAAAYSAGMLLAATGTMIATGYSILMRSANRFPKNNATSFFQ